MPEGVLFSASWAGTLGRGETFFCEDAEAGGGEKSEERNLLYPLILQPVHSLANRLAG